MSPALPGMPSGSLAHAERLALCDTFASVGPDAPTLCTPWTTRDLAAHLVVREQRPDLAAGIVVPFLADRTERAQSRVASRPWGELVETVRTGPPVWHPTRLGPVDEVVNLAEMVVHHEDVLRGDSARGPRRTPSVELEDAVWALLSRMGRLLFRRVDDGVELHAPGRDPIVVSGGDETVTVTGAPLEVLLTAYGRREVADVEVSGPEDAVARFDTAHLGL